MKNVAPRATCAAPRKASPSAASAPPRGASRDAASGAASDHSSLSWGAAAPQTPRWRLASRINERRSQRGGVWVETLDRPRTSGASARRHERHRRARRHDQREREARRLVLGGGRFGKRRLVEALAAHLLLRDG